MTGSNDSKFTLGSLNDVQAIKSLLDNNLMDINFTDSSGRIALYISILSKSMNAIKFLIQRGARISRKMQDGRTAIHLAAQYGLFEVVELLLESGRELSEEAKRIEEEKLISLSKKSIQNPKKRKKMMTTWMKMMETAM